MREAQQIENGSMPYIANFKGCPLLYSSGKLNQKNTFIIRRSMPTFKYYEYWKLKDMIY